MYVLLDWKNATSTTTTTPAAAVATATAALNNLLLFYGRPCPRIRFKSPPSAAAVGVRSAQLFVAECVPLYANRPLFSHKTVLPLPKNK